MYTIKSNVSIVHSYMQQIFVIKHSFVSFLKLVEKNTKELPI